MSLRTNNGAYELEYFQYLHPEILTRTILCLDPGETMSWSVFADGQLYEAGQLSVRKALRVNEDPDTLFNVLENFFNDRGATHCVMEDYIVYAHKLKAHVWNPLFTSKLIGSLSLMCSQRQIPIQYQMAGAAKFFSTDEKLKRWGLWQVHHKHANDSIRHGLYYMLSTSMALNAS